MEVRWWSPGRREGIDLLGSGECFSGMGGGEKGTKDAEQRYKVGCRRLLDMHLQQPDPLLAHPPGESRAGEPDTACREMKK